LSSSQTQTATSKTPFETTSWSKPTIFIFRIGSLFRGRSCWCCHFKNSFPSWTSSVKGKTHFPNDKCV
jgi:hypothetical protein